MKVANKMQIYRLIYYSKSALHVSGDVFAHHQEHLTVFTVKKGKAIPLQAGTGPKGSRRLRLPDFKTIGT